MGQICGKGKKFVVPKGKSKGNPKEGNVERVNNQTDDPDIQVKRVTSLVNENVSKEVQEVLANTFENPDVIEEAKAKTDVKKEQESKTSEINVAGDVKVEPKRRRKEGLVNSFENPDVIEEANAKTNVKIEQESKTNEIPVDNLKEPPKEVEKEKESKTNEINVDNPKESPKDVKNEQESKPEETSNGEKLEEIRALLDEDLLNNLKEPPTDLSEENKEEYTNTPRNSTVVKPAPALINNEILNAVIVDKIEAPEADKKNDESVLFFGGGDPNIPSDIVTDLVDKFLDKVEEVNGEADDDKIDSSFTVVEKADTDASNNDIEPLEVN